VYIGIREFVFTIEKFGWETDQHLGKEFYGDFGQYEVEMTLPNNYIMDGTGELQNETEVLPPALRAKLDLKNFEKNLGNRHLILL